MWARRFVFAALGFLFVFCTGTAVAQQCSHHIGNWTDNYYFLWSVYNDGNGVVDLGTECYPFSYWPFAGSSGNGFVSLTAINPGNPECTPEFWYDGGISRGGCRVAAGTWGNASGASGTFSMTKSCEVPPSGETTNSTVNWNGQYHTYGATVSEPGNGNLSGRFYREVDYAPASDECWVEGDPPQYRVTATSQSVWTLDAMDYYEDTNGRNDESIAYFRVQGRTPCKVTLFQRMEISCGVEILPGPWTQVHSQVLVYEIGTTTIKSSRGSQVRGPITYP